MYDGLCDVPHGAAILSAGYRNFFEARCVKTACLLKGFDCVEMRSANSYDSAAADAGVCEASLHEMMMVSHAVQGVVKLEVSLQKPRLSQMANPKMVAASVVPFATGFLWPSILPGQQHWTWE